MGEAHPSRAVLFFWAQCTERTSCISCGCSRACTVPHILCTQSGVCRVCKFQNPHILCTSSASSGAYKSRSRHSPCSSNVVSHGRTQQPPHIPCKCSSASRVHRSVASAASKSADLMERWEAFASRDPHRCPQRRGLQAPVPVGVGGYRACQHGEEERPPSLGASKTRGAASHPRCDPFLREAFPPFRQSNKNQIYKVRCCGT
mmetsp:Transcript_53080/g.103860  ORF Transcript_53080/g.103860 Transcript_53080/m.103860 type:complete len:203 (-) Transcript_53080:105-713(-)